MNYLNETHRRPPLADVFSGGSVEMPVQMALMIARDERAVNAFACLPGERQDEYIRRGRQAMGSAQMKQVVDDIIKIG